MKKIITLLVGVAIVGALIYFIVDYLQPKAQATNYSLIDFKIEDTASIDKIEIYNSYRDLSYTLTRNEYGTWVGPDEQCIQQNIVNMMLTTMKKITLKGYVPSGAIENMKKLLLAQYKEIKIYSKGKWTKTWYMGHSTKDHNGTYMLLETPSMKSDNPVIMGMKGFYGILGPRFFADARKFVCTDLFSYKREEMKKIQVINRVEPDESYTITIEGPDQYKVSSNGKIVSPINKNNLVFYLNGFQNIHFNQPNYTLSKKQIDSLTSLTPDFELYIEAINSNFQMDLYRRPQPNTDYPSDSIVYDNQFLWGVKEDGEVVRMQYYSIGPIIKGKLVFQP